MTSKALSREIKFRAWDKTKNYFVRSGHCVEFDGTVHEYRMGCVIPRLNEVELNQWTGLHDNNGKEIYEGDFVMFGTTRLEVIWDENRVAFATLDIKRKDMGGMQNKKGRFGEIIGNIYENPELLTKQND